MGPLLYAFYINNMTEAVRAADCTDETHANNDDLFGSPCPVCGELTMYADESTYHVANKKREDNQRKIKDNLYRLRNYMNNNKLSINIGKTKVLKLMIKQKKGKIPGQPPAITVETAPGQMNYIKDTGECKILRAVLQANITWTQHLEKGKRALFPSLMKQIGALQHLGRKILPDCRKLLAAGLIHSRLQYLMPLWGSVQNNMIRKAQSILNKAARWTSGLGRRTRTT